MIDDTVDFARALGAHGVDLVDCSSGGIIADCAIDTRLRRGFAFHAPYSAAIKAETDLLVATVGMILDPLQAESVLRHSDADLVAVGARCSTTRTGRTTLAPCSTPSRTTTGMSRPVTSCASGPRTS
jgi:2,4-dienoyl-CoA reductase-like NADH-dependent reductase (Old Yellow Enzyme family)